MPGGPQKTATNVLIQVPNDIAPLLAAGSPTPTFTNLDTDHPVMLIGEHRLRGEYTDVVGTDMFFDPTRRRHSGYVGSGTRRICFEHERKPR